MQKYQIPALPNTALSWRGKIILGSMNSKTCNKIFIWWIKYSVHRKQEGFHRKSGKQLVCRTTAQCICCNQTDL